MRSMKKEPKIPGGGGGAYSWEFFVGVCRQVLQILTLFQTKKCNYPRPFSDLRLLRLGRKHKNYSNLFGIRKFLFLSYSSGIEMIKMFIHSRSSPENHTRFQTKMGKVYTRFQTKTAQNPYPVGRHIPIWLR